MTDAPKEKKKRPSEAAQALSARLFALADSATPEVYRREARLLCEAEPAAGAWSWRLELARRAWASSPKRKNDKGRPPRLCKPAKEKMKLSAEIKKRIAHHRACLAEIKASRRLAITTKEWLDAQEKKHREALKALGAKDD